MSRVTRLLILLPKKHDPFVYHFPEDKKGRPVGMSLLRRFDYLLEKTEEILLAFGTIVLSVILLINVFLRFFFSRSIVMAEEVGQILILGITFLGLSHVARHGRHIRMSVVYDVIDKKYRKVLAIIIPLVTSITLYYLSYIAFRYTLAIKISNRVTSSLHIPVHFVTAMVAIGLFTAGSQFIRISYLNIKNIKNKEEEDLIGTYR